MSDWLSLKTKVCVVTGAADKAATGIGGNSLALECDVTRDEQIEKAHAAITSAFGSVDVLVNNA